MKVLVEAITVNGDPLGRDERVDGRPAVADPGAVSVSAGTDVLSVSVGTAVLSGSVAGAGAEVPGTDVVSPGTALSLGAFPQDVHSKTAARMIPVKYRFLFFMTASFTHPVLHDRKFRHFVPHDPVFRGC